MNPILPLFAGDVQRADDTVWAGQGPRRRLPLLRDRLPNPLQRHCRRLCRVLRVWVPRFPHRWVPLARWNHCTLSAKPGWIYLCADAGALTGNANRCRLPGAGNQLSDSIQAVCGRTCSWWRSLGTKTDFLIEQNNIFRARVAAGGFQSGIFGSPFLPQALIGACCVPTAFRRGGCEQSLWILPGCPVCAHPQRSGEHAI